MKFDKFIPSISAKTQFVNEYIDLLTYSYNNNSKRITNYIENNLSSYAYLSKELYKHPELASLIHSQIDIVYNINVGKALKNDIVAFDKLSKQILLTK